MLQIDYVTTFAVDADDSIGSPPHWLYMSLGFSDLYGDGRLFASSPNDGVSSGCHELLRPLVASCGSGAVCNVAPPAPPNCAIAGHLYHSGFGFEMTFRLIRHPWEATAPPWPVKLMNNLCRCVTPPPPSHPPTTHQTPHATHPCTPHATHHTPRKHTHATTHALHWQPMCRVAGQPTLMEPPFPVLRVRSQVLVEDSLWIQRPRFVGADPEDVHAQSTPRCLVKGATAGTCGRTDRCGAVLPVEWSHAG